MKKHLSIAVLSFAFLSACASVDIQQGRPFNTQRVTEIKKGETTKAQVLSMFGEPHTRAVTGDGEKWIYEHVQGKSHAQSYIVSMKVQTTGTRNRLEIQFKDDVVQDFSYSVGAI